MMIGGWRESLRWTRAGSRPSRSAMTACGFILAGSRSAGAASSRSWREAIRRTVPERERMTSDSVVAPRAPS